MASRVMSSAPGRSPSGCPTGSWASMALARAFANTTTPAASVPSMASGAASSNASNVGGPVGIGACWRPSVGSILRASPSSCLDTCHRLEFDLAQPHGMRCDLDTLVLAHELEGLVQRELAGGYEPHQDVGGGRAHVGQVFFLHRIDVQVLRAGVFAHDHPFIDILAGLDEHRPALLQIEQGEARGLAATVSHQT